MAVFGGLITAPAWIIGIVAAVDAARTLRGRPVSRRRALAWALLATLGGLYLMYSFGHVALVAALAGISSSAVVDWPSVAILSDDGMSADYVYLNDPTFWGPVVATVLGCASLLAQAKDRGAHPAETRTTT